MASTRFLLWQCAVLVMAVGCGEISNPELDAGLSGGGTATGGGTTGGGAATGGGTTGGGTTGGGTTGGGSGTGGGGATGGGTGGGGACAEDWVCTVWSPNGDAGTASRSCIDQNGAGTTACKPPEGPLPLPALDNNYFRCQVQPLIALSCSMIGCHGDPQRPYFIYARGRMRIHETVTMTWPGCLINTPQTFDVYDRAAGTVQCFGNMALRPREWSNNFDMSRALALGTAVPDDAQLLAQPNSANTGYAHSGMKFWDPGSQAYRTIAIWLDGGTQATCDAGFNDHN